MPQWLWEHDFTGFCECLNEKEAIYPVVYAWNSAKENNIRKAFDKMI